MAAGGFPFPPAGRKVYGWTGQSFGGQIGGKSPPKFTGVFADNVMANNASPAKHNRIRFLTGATSTAVAAEIAYSR